MKDIIIAIDGHSSCGKSTLAKAIAKKLEYRYIDTGAMYRAVALYFMRKNMLDPVDTNAIIKQLDEIEIRFEFDPTSDKTVTFLNGENVEDEIRDVPVSQNVSKVSQIPEVRSFLVDQQQKMGDGKKIVMDGRDIGTRVFPDAELKLFVTADLEIRAERRLAQMLANGIDVDLDTVKENLAKRDYDDTHKGEAPLKKAEDAVLLDNSELNVQEGIELSMDLAMDRIKN